MTAARTHGINTSVYHPSRGLYDLGRPQPSHSLVHLRPWGLRIIVVGASASLCLLIGFLLGGGAGIWTAWVTR